MKFDLNDVVSVYLGKPNECMCGCSGNYAYTSANADYAGKDRGYPLSEDDISDRKVKARLNRFYKATNIEVEVNPNGNRKPYIFTKIIDDRQITVYLKETKQ
jgi:hypothetical protein